MLAREEGHIGIVHFIEWRRAHLPPPSPPPNLLSINADVFEAGSWGRLVIRIRGSGEATVSISGDVEWIDPDVQRLSGETEVEVPVKLRTDGNVPVGVTVEGKWGEASKIVWLNVTRMRMLDEIDSMIARTREFIRLLEGS